MEGKTVLQLEIILLMAVSLFWKPEYVCPEDLSGPGLYVHKYTI